MKQVDACLEAGASGMIRWLPGHIDAIEAECFAPPIGSRDLKPVNAEICIWDAWPIECDGGAHLSRPELWLALAAPWREDPDERHAVARIYLLERTADRWKSHGPAMPDGFSPGSREWSGSARLLADGETLILYFTAAGRRGEGQVTFEQRLFEATSTLRQYGQGWRLDDWRALKECVVRDPRYYMSSLHGTGAVGTIKAFRDPSFFSDPISRQNYLFFTASLANSKSEFNGAIGAAVASDPQCSHWQLQPPLIGALDVNNELERPHVRYHNGCYYLFWSTQSTVFAPGKAAGPTGLYAMVSDRIFGRWVPVNGSGIVIANPLEAPRQAYSWYVLPDLSVTSFVDDWGRGDADPGGRRFGGCFAPFLRLELNGSKARLVA